MIRSSAGHAGKATPRCRHCQSESLKPRVPPWETLITMSCHYCGADIVLRPDLLRNPRRKTPSDNVGREPR